MAVWGRTNSDHYWGKHSRLMSARVQPRALWCHQTTQHDVNTTSTSEQQALQLVDIIDFKWLMTGEGHPVHVERLQSDAAYAARCLALAAASPSAALRAAGLRLERLLASSARQADA
jgi:hypothetical protein